MNYDFKEQLNQKVAEVEAIIKTYLPLEEGYQKTVLEAMNYSFLAGGKRLRPMLMLETYRLFRGNDTVVEPFMAAQEMIHTYSLIHDDLPAMDNDEYRRGRKTCHVIYGEAMAILAGDSLLNYAYETAAKSFQMIPGDASAQEQIDFYRRVTKAIEILSRKAGIYGMVGGQVADVEAEKKNLMLDEKKLIYIHEHKTAALIQSAMMIGAVLAGANAEQLNKLNKCAFDIGIAFQIQDDILDVTSTLEVLGKPIGSDERNDKLTYVKAHGLEQSKEEVKRLSEDAIAILKSLPGKNAFLEQLIRTLITREK